MINELYEVARAMQKSHVLVDTYAQNYNEVSYKEGICVCVADGHIRKISSISQEQKANIRNYTGTSNGGFPCVKLAPLYRIVDKNTIQMIKSVKRKPELLDAPTLSHLCGYAIPDNNNWDNSIAKKYENAQKLASKIQEKLSAHPCVPFEALWEEFRAIPNLSTFHDELTKTAIETLSSGIGVPLMLNLLFFCIEDCDGKKASNDEKKRGEISVLFDAERLYKLRAPVTSRKFTEELNEALLAAEQQKAENHITSAADAFGQSYYPREDVMPNIRIGAGFFVKVRTMNKDIPCQHKYKQEGSQTYPASNDSRLHLQQALSYISGIENEEKTWICIDSEEKRPRDILFAYPLQLNKVPENFAKMFKRPQESDASSSFSGQAQKLIYELKKPHDVDETSNAGNIRIFILRRLNVDNNSGRTKVIYSRRTDANELEKCSEAWAYGCANLPAFPFGAPQVPYPLDAADILNRFWKQNGEIVTDKFKPFSKHHGLELLMEPNLPTASDLHRLTESAMNIGPLLGNLCAKRAFHHTILERTKDMPAMLGLLLNRRHIGKDRYMENLPYLYGQLLKAADELHALYCTVVRNGDIPPQLVGSSLFRSAAEAPTRTMQRLSQRLMPYYTWATSYRLQNVKAPGKESWRAGWLYGICEKIMGKLQENWTAQTRFSEEEKAQLFIGYLAAFPKKEQAEQNIEEDAVHE